MMPYLTRVFPIFVAGSQSPYSSVFGAVTQRYFKSGRGYDQAEEK
jgi:hypothetical protein